MRGRFLVIVSALLSAAYLSGTGSLPGRFLVKSGSIAALAALAALNGSPGLALGLLLSSLGDALLEIDASLFTAGLLAFLCAHLVYTAVFLRGRVAGHLTTGRWIAIAAVVSFSGGFAMWLMPGAGRLAIPVAFYMIAITTMVVSSIVARSQGPWLPIGAALFLISDAILATNKFKTPVPARDYLVWITYYAGQVLIAMTSSQRR